MLFVLNFDSTNPIQWHTSSYPQASFFGVGAPEAVVVGLVAVVIFGPQGLAEVRDTHDT